MSEIPAEKTFGIGFKDKFGYALGDATGILTFGVIGAFLQIFYTNVLYIDPAKIMVLFMIARIWDAVNDPMWGAFIDSRRPGKNGKFRPYLRWASLPLAVAGVLVFLKIPGLSENGYLIYAYITYIFYGMAYTAINIPYGSLASVITTDELERSSLSMFRSIGAGLGGLPGQILLPLIVYSTVIQNGTETKILDGNKLFWGVLVLGVCTVIVYNLCYSMTKERVVSRKEDKKSDTKKTIRALLHNWPFLSLCFVSMLLIAIQQYTQTVYNYLFLNYFEKPNLYALVTVFTYLPMALLLPVMQKLVRRFGKKELCGFGMALAALSNLILWLLHTESVTVFFIFIFLSGLGMTFLVLEVWALATDVIDYQEHLSGQRDEGTSYAFYSFMRKLGQTGAGVLGTGILGIIGYDAKALTAEAVAKLYPASTLIPAAAMLVSAVLLLFFYPLSKKRLAELKQQNG